MSEKSKIKVFVKSAGSHPNQGYSWWRSTPDKPLTREEPSFIKQLSSIGWLDREAFLLLVLRDGEGLHLYVTALETEGREDFQGRKIRNDIALTVNYDQESELLDLICALLKNKEQMEHELNKIIRPEKTKDFDTSGFTANYNEIIQWIKNGVASVPQSPSRIEAELGGQIAKNSPENRKKLAELLKQHTLPKEIGFLLAVTRFSDPARFMEANNWWRVLTELENSEDWRQLYPVKNSLVNTTWKPIAGIFLVILSAIAFLIRSNQNEIDLKNKPHASQCGTTKPDQKVHQPFPQEAGEHDTILFKYDDGFIPNPLTQGVGEHDSVVFCKTPSPLVREDWRDVGECAYRPSPTVCLSLLPPYCFPPSHILPPWLYSSPTSTDTSKENKPSKKTQSNNSSSTPSKQDKKDENKIKSNFLTHNIEFFFQKVSERNLVAVKSFIDNGYDLNLSYNNENALLIATTKGYTEIVNILLNNHANVNLKDEKYGITALIIASSKGNIEIVRELLNKGADVDLATNDGITALMTASINGHTEVVKEFLKKGANVDIKYKGMTVMDAAYIKGYFEIVSMIENHKIKENF